MAKVFRCLRPSIIVNKIGERVTVNCGYCSACLSKKSSYAGKLCVLESESNRFCTFVTLTYSQETLPVAKVCTYGSNHYLINVTERLRGTSENDCIGVIDQPYSLGELSFIFNKVFDDNAKTPYSYGEGYIPYLSKVDAQNFLKRLRYYISDFCEKNNIDNEKIRYYIGSEYGPEHFRPHFHILFFYNSAWLREELPGFLHQAWTFGNIDYSQVQNHGGCSSYVASYCNCFSYLPSIYKSKGLRPFTLHSVRFGQKPFDESFKKILKGESTEHDRVTVQYGDKIREVFAPLSLSSTLLPRCFHYVLSDDYVRYKLLSIFDRVVTKFSIREPSVSVVSSVILYVEPSFKSELDSLLKKDLTDSEINSIVQSSFKYWRLKQEYPCVDIRKHIDDYYSAYNSRRLRDFYSSQADFINRYGSFNREFLVHYYDNVYIRGFNFHELTGLSPLDVKLSKLFYASINIEWEFLDSSQLEYQKNPSYRDAKIESDFIFSCKSKVKKYNDKFKSNVLKY